MDELNRTSRLARRLALAATICCSAASVCADKPVESTPGQTLGSLLSQGWTGGQPTQKVQQPAPAPPTSNMAIVRPPTKILEVPDLAFPPQYHTGSGLGGSDALTVANKSAAATEKNTSEIATAHQVAATPSGTSIAQLIKQRAVPHVVEEAKASSETVTPAPANTSFAQLIKQQPAPRVVQERKSDSEPMDIELAPNVSRVDVERHFVANTIQLQSESASNFNVRAAEPIQTEPIQTEPTQTEPTPRMADVAAVVREIVPAVDAIPLSSVADVGPAANIESPEHPDTGRPAQARPNESLWADADPQPKESPEPRASEAGPPTTELAVTDSRPHQEAAGRESEPVTAESLIGLPPSLDSSSSIASNGGPGLVPLEDSEGNPAARLDVDRAKLSLTATIHATRLREVAQEALRNSKHRLERQATHSAKKFALEALRSIVAMQDAQAGGNWHAQQLEIAFTAIRESQDISGQFGAIDQEALKRKVAVHETDVLKGRDLESVSALEATESYLAVARTHLVLAAGGIGEASDALVLLGQIEKLMSQPGDTHAAAIAVTLHRTAIEIEPTNAFGYRELGTTLLKQGLVEQAAWALNRSVEIQPTRTGYEQLLEASRRLGDVDTARVCLASLQKPNMQSEIPVHNLSTKEFAATYRPNPAAMEPVNAKSKLEEAKAQKKDESRLSLRALFPFVRR